MKHSKLYVLVTMLISLSCSKEEKPGTATITVKPHLGDTVSIAEPFTTYFDAIVKTSDTSLKVASGHIYYTTNGSLPTQETTSYVDLDQAHVTINTDDTVSVISNELPEISESVTIKYLAVVQLTQEVEKESMGSKKTSTEIVTALSEIGSVSYTWEGDVPPVEDPDTDSTDTDSSTVDNTPTGPVAMATGTPVSIGLTAISGAATPTSIKCFAIRATALDASGNAMISDQTVTLTLTTLSGSGSFYNNSSCSSIVTSATLLAGNSEKNLFYKDNTAESISVKVVYAGVSSNTYALVLGPPQVGSMLVTPAGTRGPCTYVGVSIKDSSGSYMFASVTQATVLTLTKTSGTSSRFWTSSDCSTGSLLTPNNGNVTTISIPAGSNSAAVYFESVVGGSWVFSGTWDSGAASGSGLAAALDIFY